MSELDDTMKGVQRREVLIRAVDTEKREIEGIAVPWGQTADIGWFTESVERGAVVESDDAQLWWRHKDPIGAMSYHEDQDGGWFVRMKVSKTSLGEDALTLARDGVVTNFSIGFEPIEYTIREDGDKTHITQTKIRVREISLVPLPAYEGAKVSNVREGNSTKGTALPVQEITTPSMQDFTELRAGVEEVERRMATFQSAPEKPSLDTRSAAEVLRAIAIDKDETTIREYDDLLSRAFTGGTVADAVDKPGWVGDLTRIINSAAPLVDFFSRGTLPSTGMSIEYAQLLANTVDYAEQAAEGDDLVFGKVSIETKTAPVKTYGGWSELSRQAIERSSINVLQTTLDAQAVAAGKMMNAAFRLLFDAQHTAQTTALNTVTIPSAFTFQDWINGIVDAAIKFDALGLPIEGLLANPVLFKALGNLEAADGRPVLLVAGAGAPGANTVGTINPSALTGSLAGITVQMDAGWTGASAAGAFANSRALRSYVAPVTRLQDENIINLSKQYSVYNYAAFAPEIPAALVPIAFSV